MKNIIIPLILLMLIGGSIFAQHAHFVTSGSIEFERKTNAFEMIRKEIVADNEAILRPALEAYKKGSPQFRTLKSTLAFGGNKTLFTPVETEPPANALMAGSPLMNQNNIVYTDLTSGTNVSQRTIYDEPFLVKDSTRKIKWKITDETREIAGYTCRRANGIFLDSVYVVAFYTNQLPVKGGPESFGGLPGMILGVAIPHENITWFATKVTETAALVSNILPPKKGKITDYKGLAEILKATAKDHGSVARDFTRWYLF